MREYEIWRIVDVNMYNSLLSPEFTLEEGVLEDVQEAAREALWDRFDLNKYKAFICERAVIELKKLLWPDMPPMPRRWEHYLSAENSTREGGNGNEQADVM